MLPPQRLSEAECYDKKHDADLKAAFAAQPTFQTPITLYRKIHLSANGLNCYTEQMKTGKTYRVERLPIRVDCAAAYAKPSTQATTPGPEYDRCPSRDRDLFHNFFHTSRENSQFRVFLGAGRVVAETQVVDEPLPKRGHGAAPR